MIGYRFLSPADEEMTEASLFYEAAARGLGNDFLNDVQQAIDRLCELRRRDSRCWSEKDFAASLSI